MKKDLDYNYLKPDLQEHLEVVLDKLGNPGEWSQGNVSKFFMKFFKESLINKQLLL